MNHISSWHWRPNQDGERADIARQLMQTTPTVFAIDDDPAILDSLRYLVGGLGFKYEAFASSEAFLHQVDFEKPGCLILDMGMPGESGEELFDRLLTMGGCWPTIAITGHGEFALGVRMVKKGVLDFLEKPFSADGLKELVQKAVGQDMLRRMNEDEVAKLRKAIDSLDESQKAILREIRKGTNSKDIAIRLDISLRTVQLRRSKIAKKLGVAGRSGWSKLIFVLAKLDI